MAECSVVGCQKLAHSRTYCHMHYRRWYISGDVLKGQSDGWGKRGKNPHYHRWGEVKKKISSTHLWREFWTFVKDIGQIPEYKCTLWPKDKNREVGPDNFYWKESIPSKDKAEYARGWRKANPDKARNNELKKSFGITLNEYNRILDIQNGVCAICYKKCELYNNLSVDHCHDSKKVRGLLCTKCNQAIGLLREDKKIMEAAINYLEKNG